MKRKILVFFSVIIYLFSCKQVTTEGKLLSGNGYNRQEMLSIAKAIHQLECTYMHLGGINGDTLSMYDFRSTAFQEILKERNRKVLVEYEDHCQKLAALEHELSSSNQTLFHAAVDSIYRSGCNNGHSTIQ